MHNIGELLSPTNSLRDYSVEIPLQSGYEGEMWISHPSNDLEDLRGINSQDLLGCGPEVAISIESLLAQSLDNVGNKVKHQVLPDFEPLDGEMGFEIKPELKENLKKNWLYSEKYKKIYTKPNEIVNIGVSLKPTSEYTYLRAMLVFNSASSKPVVRCENHSSKDQAEQKNIKHSVLRCENQNVIYEGSLTGKNISDRLAVRIPLGCAKAIEDKLIKQTVALKFVCQNSCVGRLETSIIFYLVNAKDEILAKKIIGVKICSCPKRDMIKEEGPKKRPNTIEYSKGKKILKIERVIKEELDQDDEDGSLSDTPEGSEFCRTSSGVKLTLDLPDLEAAVHVVECAYNKVAAELHIDRNNARLHSKFCSLKNTLVKLKELNEQMN